LFIKRLEYNMNLLERFVYRFIWVLTKFFAYILYPHTVTGKNNAKLKEPYIFCSNHISMLDSIILVGSVLPKKAIFMGKGELYKTKIGNWFFRAIGSFPVQRGTADMSAIKTSIEHLAQGDSMMIFPEGTRNLAQDGSIMEFFNGVGIIAIKSSCKIIPCYIDCKGGYKLFKRFKINVGKPIDIDEWSADGLKKNNLNSLMIHLRKKMEELMQIC